MSKILNAEIKAHCINATEIQDLLIKHGAELRGGDTQVDTYFNVPDGRLKLRAGNIENSLIFYKRADKAQVRESSIFLERLSSENNLTEILGAALGKKVVVKKKRKIFFIDNVKFHLDEVDRLGEFVEIEAIDVDGKRSLSELQAQCSHFVELLGIKNSDFLSLSYSDLVADLDK